MMAINDSDDADLQRGHFSQVKHLGIHRIFGRSQEWEQELSGGLRLSIDLTPRRREFLPGDGQLENQTIRALSKRLVRPFFYYFVPLLSG